MLLKYKEKYITPDLHLSDTEQDVWLAEPINETRCHIYTMVNGEKTYLAYNMYTYSLRTKPTSMYYSTVYPIDKLRSGYKTDKSLRDSDDYSDWLEMTMNKSKDQITTYEPIYLLDSPYEYVLK
jgi:hypothetical protein